MLFRSLVKDQRMDIAFDRPVRRAIDPVGDRGDPESSHFHDRSMARMGECESLLYSPIIWLNRPIQNPRPWSQPGRNRCGQDYGRVPQTRRLSPPRADGAIAVRHFLRSMEAVTSALGEKIIHRAIDRVGRLPRPEMPVA